MKRNTFLTITLLITAAILSSCAATKQSKMDKKLPKDTVSVKQTIIDEPKDTVSVKQKIIGEWYIEELQYVFNKDGYATLTMGNQTIGGSDLFAESVLKYEIDESKDPITLDLVHLEKSTGKIRNKMPMIIKFTDDDKLVIRSFMTNDRPKEFVEGDDEFTVVFDRKTK